MSVADDLIERRQDRLSASGEITTVNSEIKLRNETKETLKLKMLEQSEIAKR